MQAIRTLVVVVLLGVWCFPAVSVAKPLATPSTEVGSRAASDASPTQPSTQTEESALGAREKLTQDLQNFRGGGVYIYLGGGVVLVLLIILLILVL